MCSKKAIDQIFARPNHIFERFFSDKQAGLDSSKVNNKTKTYINKRGPMLFGTSFRAAMNLIIKSDGVKSKVMWISSDDLQTKCSCFQQL